MERCLCGGRASLRRFINGRCESKSPFVLVMCSCYRRSLLNLTLFRVILPLNKSSIHATSVYTLSRHFLLGRCRWSQIDQVKLGLSYRPGYLNLGVFQTRPSLWGVDSFLTRCARDFIFFFLPITLFLKT